MHRSKRVAPALLLGFVATLLVPTPASAQLNPTVDPFFEPHVSLEGRLGASLPTGELSDVGATAAPALTLNLLYNFTAAWAGYVGWGFHDFGCDGCPDDLGSAGPHAGAQYTLPWRGRALPWIRAGLVLATLSIFQDGAGVDSGSELGLEIGTGVDFRLTEHVSVSPGASFTFYKTRGLPAEDLFVPYFLLDLGGTYNF
jgi:hypothetical protein